MASPYDVPHTGSSLKELAAAIKKLHGETRIVMEATGNYYEPIARYLHGQGIFVSIVNPMLISDFDGNTLRRPKTDKKDAVKLALYPITKKGSSPLRRTLFTIMMALIQNQPADNPVYQFLDKKRSEGNIITAT